MSLHAILGHERARTAFADALAADLLPSALLLHGDRGIGKQRLALWLAQLTVCAHRGREPCGACQPCRMATSLEHPDVHWYFPLPRPKGVSGDKLQDALETARLAELAELRTNPLRTSHRHEVRGIYLGSVRSIREKAYMRPAMAAGSVFIIGDAELLVPQESSPEAANALLKLLEEPPGASRFILTSSEPRRLLPTILSRTVPYHLTGLPHGAIGDFLAEGASVSPDVAAWAASLSQGSIGRALGFLPDGGAAGQPGPLEELRRRAFELVAAAASGDPGRACELALRFPPAGARGLLGLFGFVEELLRDLAAAGTGAENAVLNGDLLEELRSTASRAGVRTADVVRALPSVERARRLAYGNVNPQLVVHGLLRDLATALAPPLPLEVGP